MHLNVITVTNKQKTERQLLMTLRNRIISIGHSIRSPQVPSPARVEANTSYYRIADVFPVCSLLVSSVLIPLTEQNFQLPLQRFPSKLPNFSDFPSRISQAMSGFSLLQ